MRHIPVIALTLTVSLAVACDDHGDEDHELEYDEEACEHLAEGPYQPIVASDARDGEAPWIGTDHKAYTLTLPAGVPGYGSYDSSAAGDIYLFVDQALPVKLFTSAGAEVPFKEQATSSEVCDTIKGRYVAEVAVGLHFVELGTAAGVTSVNVVIETGHEH